MRTLVIIPSYNESENIVALSEKIFSLYSDIDVLIVDDSSPDGTADLVREAQNKWNDRLQLIVRTGKGGRGSAVLAGFKYALEHGYEIIFEMDADFSHKPEEIQRFLDAIQNCDCVVGSRYLPESEIHFWGPKRTFFSFWANKYARIVLQIPLTDYTNGFRCYRRSAIEALNMDAIDAKGYVVLSEIAYMLHKKKMRFSEVPTVFVNRRRGESNLGYHEIHEAFFSVLRIRSPRLYLHVKQILKFIICGCSGAVIDLGSLAFFVEVMSMRSQIAIFPSTLIAAIFVFFFNRHVTFKGHDQRAMHQMMKFALVYVLAIILNIAFASLFLWLGVFYLIAKAIAIGIVAVLNYMLSHSFIFSKGTPQNT